MYSRTFKANGKWAKAIKRGDVWKVVFGYAGDTAIASRTVTTGKNRTHAVISAVGWIND